MPHPLRRTRAGASTRTRSATPAGPRWLFGERSSPPRTCTTKAPAGGSASVSSQQRVTAALRQALATAGNSVSSAPQAGERKGTAGGLLHAARACVVVAGGEAGRGGSRTPRPSSGGLGGCAVCVLASGAGRGGGGGGGARQSPFIFAATGSARSSPCHMRRSEVRRNADRSSVQRLVATACCTADDEPPLLMMSNATLLPLPSFLFGAAARCQRPPAAARAAASCCWRAADEATANTPRNESAGSSCSSSAGYYYPGELYCYFLPGHRCCPPPTTTSKLMHVGCVAY